MSPSREVEDATGEAPARPDYDQLARKAEALRKIVSAPSDKEAAAEELQEIERQLAARREVEGTTAARARMIGIKRASGSLLDQYEIDQQAVRTAVAAVADAIQTLNGRAGQLQHLRAEAKALADRFDLQLPKLPVLSEPAAQVDVTLPGFLRFGPSIPPLEWDEHHLRQRRTYEEVADTEAFRIIVTAGLRAWPALTPNQKAAVAEREEDQREQVRAQAEFAREAAHLLVTAPVDQTGIREG